MTTSTSVTFGNGSVQSLSFDAVSRLQGLTNDLGGGATTHDLTQSFAYNPASQIAGVTRSNDAYAWGAHSNADRSYAADGLNRLMSAGGTALGYDARGNITSVGSASYSYTAENMLKAAPGGASLSYDPLGRLYEVVKAPLTTRFLYDGADLIAETDGSNAMQRRYVHGPGIDDPIVWYEGAAIGNATRRFLMADERGSVLSVSDSAGAVLGLNAYDEYGNPAPGNLGRFGYTGQAWLAEGGLWHYKARMYAPALGRFMQTDPIGYAEGLNWYDYVGGDPVNYIDPLGLENQQIVVTGQSCRKNPAQAACVRPIALTVAQDNRGRRNPGPRGNRARTGEREKDNTPCPAGKVLTIGIAGDLSFLGGVSGEAGVAINLETGNLALYGSGGKTAGVDTGVGITGGLFRSMSDLMGRFTEIEIGVLAGAGSIVTNSNREVVAATGTVGVGIPASGRVTRGNTSVIGGGCRDN